MESEEVIANRYELRERIGQGGMGVVYRGFDPVTQQPIAVKQLKPEIANDDLIERFRREGEALRDLNHPNIVKLLDTVVENGDHYLIMEYVAGGDLTGRLSGGPVPVNDVLNLALQLADALTRAHYRQIIHRDLKPANILVDDANVVHLTDFGVALVGDRQRMTTANAMVGTIDYLAPELLKGEPAGSHSDIWAFGIILFEMLGGQRPFQGDSVVATLQAILNTPLPDLEQLNPETPKALVDLTYRMLERDTASRVSSVRHVGAALEDIQMGRTSVAAPRPRFETPRDLLVAAGKHNLPGQTTPLVGRLAELQSLREQLAGQRLVTIVGPGGMGKTSLALACARSYLSKQTTPADSPLMPFPDGIYFVDLAPLDNPDDIVQAIANALDYRFQSDEQAQRDQIIDFLRSRQMLLILDNFEQLLVSPVGGRQLVMTILKAAPRVKILVTSRQRLNLTGEILFHLGGLDFPTWETPDDAARYAAVQLFLQSARRVQPDFELDKENLDAVARICKLVQGLPLGIILAAAWLEMLSPAEIAAEIEQNLDFLAGEMADLPERQRSMEAVFDYSWQLLTPAEQAAFTRLSLFRGGFTREAAQEVAGANLRLLLNLVNKSLLQRDGDSGRYAIHELLRQYGERRLQAGANADTYYAAHAHYFARWTNEQWAFHSLKSPKVLEQMIADYDNIRLAWEYGVHRQEVEILALMAYCLADYFDLRGHIAAGRALFVPAITMLQTLDSAQAARALAIVKLGYAWLWVAEYPHKSKQITLEALPILESLPADRYLAAAYCQLGHRGVEPDTEKGYAETMKAVRLAQQLDDHEMLIVAQIQRMTIVYLTDYQGSFSHAEAMELVAYMEKYTPLHLYLCVAYQGMAELAERQNQADQALLYFEKAVVVSSAWKNVYLVGWSLGNIARIYAARGQDKIARQKLREIIHWHQAVAQEWQTLGAVADIAARHHRLAGGDEAATTLLSMADHHPDKIPNYQVHIIDPALEKLEARLGSERFAAAWERGRTMTLAEAVKTLLATLAS